MCTAYTDALGPRGLERKKKRVFGLPQSRFHVFFCPLWNYFPNPKSKNFCLIPTLPLATGARWLPCPRTAIPC